MLADLARERAQGRTRSLVVSATGTGKTVLAALDYRNTCQQLGHRPRLLYVAHRAQILRQALRTYREVLRDHSFGGLLTGSEGSGQYTHVFATIDTLASRDLVRSLGPDYWHTVVIDECHRLAGPRFDALASTITPQLLLGLTATPERTDGRPIEIYFTPRPDRSPAVELRLWDALDMQLLAPFEYYACDDDTDFSEVQWDRPGELTALDGLVTGNMVRARMIVNEWRRLATNPRKSRALVFCVSVAHARFMTEQLNAEGLPVACVTGETPKADQVRAVKHLERNDVCALVTVDLFNEGVDVPSVDTLLLLRPTQSPVLFQQQIGRGLRLAPGKDSCLILDFVGQHRADFRFDRLLASITGLTRAQLIDAVEGGFSTLPAGCHIHLHRKAREQVLQNLRTLTQQSWRRLTSELRSYAELRRPITLPDFLHHQRLALEEVYRTTKPSGWTTLKRSAGLLSGEEASGESQLSSRFGDLLHVDDPDQISIMRSFAAEPGPFVRGEAVDPLRAQMLAYQVDSGREALPYSEFARRVAESPSCVAELGELADVLAASSRIDAGPVPGVEDLPLRLHAAYRIREILTAVGFLTEGKRTPFQAGVLALPVRKTELMFVTLDKSQGFHERIAYHDYAVSPARFHWQTQNAAGPDTTAGRRYIGSPHNGWTFQLFIRVTKDDPYRACGPVRLVDPQDVVGDRPMNITWTLEVPLPPHLFREFSVLRGQS
jgi:superfamily II DNA or RNA helicase